MTAGSLVRMRGVGRAFRSGLQQTQALRDVDLDLEPGEYVAITGPSGCGKSTLLSILGLLDAPSDGAYELRGQPVASLGVNERARVRGRDLGFVFQSFNLISEMRVRENVELPLLYQDVPPAERLERTEEMLDRVGMLPFADHFPAHLSGGQQQRAAIARAMVTAPALLLADEPTGNLDSANGEAVMDLLDALHAGGAAIVLVTHEPRYAERAGRTLHMLDGRIVRDERTEARGAERAP